jgi:hypothetical protein
MGTAGGGDGGGKTGGREGKGDGGCDGGEAGGGGDGGGAGGFPGGGGLLGARANTIAVTWCCSEITPFWDVHRKNVPTGSV